MFFRKRKCFTFAEKKSEMKRKILINKLIPFERLPDLVPNSFMSLSYFFQDERTAGERFSTFWQKTGSLDTKNIMTHWKEQWNLLARFTSKNYCKSQSYLTNFVVKNTNTTKMYILKFFYGVFHLKLFYHINFNSSNAQ